MTKREAALAKALQGLVDAYDAPHYGDQQAQLDHIWDHMGEARAALKIWYEPAEHSTGMAGNSAEQRKAETMTQFRFMYLCNEALIMPELALENEKIVAAAEIAGHTENAKLGPENSRGFDCGFAWLEFRPATTPFARWLKAQGISSPLFVKSGAMVWYSAVWSAPTQSISVHIAACQAACEVLKAHGIACSVGSRLD